MKSGIRPERYEVATIVRTKEGEWGAYYWGLHAEQGGMNFTKGNVFCEDLDTLLAMVKQGLGDNVDKIDKLIQDKSKWKKGKANEN